MCNKACLEFGKHNLLDENVRGKKVIEVGSLDVNGSLRSLAESFSPEKYVGVDIQMGNGVDEICSTDNLVARFGVESFDLIVCTEVLEHVEDWRRAVSNFKRILKPRGVLLLTTRSKGFYYHDFPFDCWRYEVSDMQYIFSDFVIESLEKDPSEPGVFLKARKPESFIENDLCNYRLYSIMKGMRSATKKKSDIYILKARRFLWLILPKAIKSAFGKRKLTIPLLHLEDFRHGR
jgi:SAM-dependent methyltransferase